MNKKTFSQIVSRIRTMTFFMTFLLRIQIYKTNPLPKSSKKDRAPVQCAPLWVFGHLWWIELETYYLTCFLKKSVYTLVCLSYDINSKCAGKR